MSTNPFSTVTVSGYNSSPPPDDGSQTAANEVTWAGIKTKLSDPLNTAIASLSTNTNAAFGALILTTDPAEETVMLHAQVFM